MADENRTQVAAATEALAFGMLIAQIVLEMMALYRTTVEKEGGATTADLEALQARRKEALADFKAKVAALPDD